MVVPKAKSRASNWLALKKSKDKVFKEKTSEYHKKLQKRKWEKKEEDQRGVIFVSNIPHGFFESQMHRYFGQFGVVQRLRLARSKRTGASCGYGYVEFEHKEVAKIVAKHMDGYLTFGKIIKCQFIPPENVAQKIFSMRDIRPHSCPKILSRKKAINKLNRFRSQSKVDRRLKRLTETYKKKLKMLESFGITLNLGLPEVETQDGEEKGTENTEESLNAETSDNESMDIDEKQKLEVAEVKENQAVKVKASVSSKPKKMKKIDGTGEKPSSEDITQDESLDSDSHHSSQNPGKMVIEVDESDEEIQFKTPPNAVKKFVKITPSLEAAENSVLVKPIPAAAKKKTPKKKGDRKRVSENMLLKELKTATTEGANPDENSSVENKMFSNPSVTRKKKVPKSKKKKFAVKGISEGKENFSETPTTVVLPDRVEGIQGNTPLSTASDISLSKTTPVKRKQVNDQTTGKNSSKKRKIMPFPATSDAQVVSVSKVSSTKGTPENREILSNGIDTSSCVEGMTNISQLPPILQTPVQTSEQTQFPMTPKRAKTPKKSKVIKKNVSPLITDTKTPKKVKKAVTPKTSESNSLPPKITHLENVSVFPESEIETSSEINTVKDVEVMKSILQSSPAVENAIQTSEQAQIPTFSKKNKTPKNKTKKILSLKRTGISSYTETPKQAKKVKNVTPKPVNSNSIPSEKVELENVTVLPKSEIKTSSGTNIAKDVEVQLSPAVENLIQTEQVQIPPSSKKTKTPKNKKKIVSQKRKGNPDYTQTPKMVEKVKEVVTPKTVDSHSIPSKNAELENVEVFQKSEIKTSSGTNIAKDLEVQVSPALENPIQTTEQVQIPPSSEKTKTPKKKKKIVSLKRTGSPDYAETPKKAKKIKKVVTTKTVDSNSVPLKKTELENVTVFPKNKIESSPGTDTTRSVELMTNTFHLSPAVENPMKTEEQVQFTPTAKKTKTPKSKTKKTFSLKRTGSPDYTPKKVEKVKKVVTSKTVDSHSIPPKNAELENVEVLRKSEIKTSSGTNIAKDLEAQVSPALENPIQISEQVQIPPSSKKTKTPKNKKKIVSQKRKGNPDYTQTPKMVEKVKEVVTPKTVDSHNIPSKNAELENVEVFQKSEIKTSSGTNIAKDLEVQVPPALENPIQTTEQVQIPPSSEKTKTPKKKKKIVSLKRTGSPDYTETPKKAEQIKEVVTTKTADSNSVPLKKAELENVTVFPKNKIESSPGTDTTRSVELMTNTFHLSPAVENPMKTEEQVQFTPTAKKTKTPKSKTKKTFSLKRTGSPDYTPKKVEKVKKVVTSKTVDSHSIPPKNAELENVEVLRKSEIKTSSGTNIAKDLEAQVSPAVENPIQISEQVQIPPSSKKTKTPKNKKKIVSLKRKGNPDYTQTPKMVEKVKEVVTPKTVDSHSIPSKNAELENVEVFQKSEIKTSSGTNIAKDLEVQVSPALENPIQTTEQVQIPPSSEKTKTPKNKSKKIVSQKRTGSPDYTQTPKKVEKVKKVVTPKTVDSSSIPSKNAELENLAVFQKNEIKTSPGTNTVTGEEVMTNLSQLSRAEENPSQTLEQVQLSLSYKKIETPKKTPKRRDSRDYTKTPKKVKAVKNIVTPKTPERNGLPPKIESENVIVSSESEKKTLPVMNTAESVEMVSNTSLLSPEVEIPIQTSEQVPLSSKKIKTSKNKTPKKAISPKITGNSDITQTPKMKKSNEKVITKTHSFNKFSPKKSKLGNFKVVLKEKCISSTTKEVTSLTPARLKQTPKQKIKPKVPKTA